jgi:hypothetical protein
MSSRVYVDASSLEAVLSGLIKRHLPSLNEWEWRALADLTMVTVTHKEVDLAVSLGKGAALNSYPPEIELIKRILEGSLTEVVPSRSVKAAAKEGADRWISLHGGSLMSHYRSLWDTAPAVDLLHFEMSNTLLYDARRLGGLIDSATLKHVAALFDWTRSDYRDVAHYVPWNSFTTTSLRRSCSGRDSCSMPTRHLCLRRQR